MDERAQLSVIDIRDNTIGLHDFRDNLSIAMMKMCSLKKPTTTSWSNRSCNGPATLFETMWTQYESFGKLEVSDDHLEPDKNPNDKLEFYGERSSVALYKKKRKRNSTALHLLGENMDVATEIEASVSKVQNVAERLDSKPKFIPIGCIEKAGNKRKHLSRSNVEKSLYLQIKMMDDSTNFQEGRTQNRIMKRVQNEHALTYLQRGQSTLMMRCVAEQILGNLLEILSINRKIYSLDYEAVMEAELNELNFFRCVLLNVQKKGN